MKRLLILSLLFCALCCTQVMAWSSSLNNGDISTYSYSTGGAGTIAYSATPYTDGERIAVIQSGGPSTNYVIFPNGSATATYFAYTAENIIGYMPGILLQASGGGIIGTYGTPGLDYTSGRYEYVRTSASQMGCYRDGVLIYSVATPITPATAFGGGGWSNGDGPYYIYVDDPSFGNAQSDTCIVSVMPHNWYLLHDYLNANHYGQYDASNSLISNSVMHIKWSIGAQNDGWSIASPPVGRYSIKVQAPSGAIAYNEYVDIAAAGHAYGYITLPQNKTHIGNQPFEYGIYFVTLYDGTAVRSTDYFRVLAANAGSTVTWDRNVYTTSDTATVTYLVDPAYYDATTYTYTLSIKNIYGVEVASYPLSTSSGTVSVPLTGYSQGVHYGQLVITQITAPTNIGILASSPMEISAYDVFNGYVMNAETGATLSGAYVNISQSLLSDSVVTNAAGAYVSSANWLVGSATTFDTALTGYTSDTLSFTPIVSKNITVNISLVPDPATTNGISIGGVVRDKTYHNPVVGANYITQNTSLSDYNTCTTNIAGFCRNDHLTLNRLYDVWSSKTGFSNSTTRQEVAVSS